MQNQNTAGSCADAYAELIMLMAHAHPKRVAVGSVAGIRCLLSGGFMPSFVFIVQPRLTAEEKSQVDEWVANDEYQFNVVLIEDEAATRGLYFKVL